MAAACAVAGAGSAPLLSGAAAAAALARAGVRLCAFDFDLTLTRIHTVGARIPAEAVPLREPLSADFFDLPFVAELLAALPAAGIAPHIVSFGRYAVIQAYMDRALGRGALGRASISTPSVVGVPDGCYVAVGADKVGSKVPQLQALAAATGVPAAATLFLDDDPSNIALAVVGGYPLSFHTPNGVTRATFSAIVAQLEAGRQ